MCYNVLDVQFQKRRFFSGVMLYLTFLKASIETGGFKVDKGRDGGQN